MYVILSYASGKTAEGVLLAVSPGRLRIVLRKRNDTIELRLSEGHWVSEDGDSVEIESLVSDGQPEMAAVYSRLAPMTRTACN